MHKKHTHRAEIYRCAAKPLSGHKYADIMPQARRIFRALEKQTKRRPYVRSAYFKKDKIFFDYFWTHLNQKYAHDRARRLKYFSCALELIKRSMQAPTTFVKVTEPNTIYHQFIGITDDSSFCIIVKQDRSSGKKYLLTLFPVAK